MNVFAVAFGQFNASLKRSIKQKSLKKILLNPNIWMNIQSESNRLFTMTIINSNSLEQIIVH